VILAMKYAPCIIFKVFRGQGGRGDVGCRRSAGHRWLDATGAGVKTLGGETMGCAPVQAGRGGPRRAAVPPGRRAR
jgi:hypothetical protein